MKVHKTMLFIASIVLGADVTHWHTEPVWHEPDTASCDTAVLTKCPKSLVWVRQQMSNAGGNVLRFSADCGTLGV